ncbi:MAG TPA: peptidylprolyl isomerase [Pseudoduganella sp.]
MAARHLVHRAALATAFAAALAGASAVAGTTAATPSALAAPVPAAASPGAVAAGAAVAARINGEPIYAFTVDTLWQQRRATKPSLERRSALDELIIARLLATHAGDGTPTQASSLTVAFAPEVMVEERLVATLREIYGKDIDAAVKALPGATLDSLVIAQPPIPQQQLEAIFGRQGPLALEIALTPEQQAQAGAIEVLRYQLPGSEAAHVTLSDVYRRQNVQGRLALFQQPGSLAATQARRIMANAFVQQWASQRFGAESVADLRKAIADSEAVATLQRMHGVGLDTDSGSPLLNRLTVETSAQEIEAFYTQHKELFARIDKVRVRHIRVADEAQAQSVLKALQEGASFAATARKMSRAPDAAKGGDLGWISANGSKDWLASLAFSQQPGKPSAPVRAPVGPHQPAYWEIVLVEEQVHGAHPLQSETVRYQASRMIAQQKATKQLGEMIEQVRRSARIEIAEAQ